MKIFIKIILGILKTAIGIISFVLIYLGSGIIERVANKKSDNKKITVRKARRIRFFTGVKRFLGRHLWLADLIGFKQEIIEMNRRLNYGMQLRNDRTAKCAI